MPKGGKGPKNPRRKPSAAAIARTSRIGSKAHRQATRAVTASGGLKSRGLDLTAKGKKTMGMPMGTEGVKTKPGEGQVAFGGRLYDRSSIAGLRSALNAKGTTLSDYFAKRPAAAARLGVTAKDLKAIKTRAVQTTAARKTVKAAAAKNAGKGKKSGKKGNKPRGGGGQSGGGAA